MFAGPASTELELTAEITSLGAPVHRMAASVRTDGAGRADTILSADLPRGRTRAGAAGHAVVMRATGPGLAVRATTAFDVAPHWSDAPRYGFLSDFGPDETPAESTRRLDVMLKLHLNVVQFYDWMPNHYRLVPETPEYADSLGRRLSRAVVERKIALCHERGIAALAYGALYGAEKEFSESHPDWLLYDGARRPLHLADRFYVQDISAGSPWREWILGQYERVLQELAFDGIHIDQYGFPKHALSQVGGTWHAVDLAAEFPPFVEEACARLRQLRPGGGSIFNCVNAWPLEAMPQVHSDAATYIEVWEPHERYRDLYELIRRARLLRPDTAVILAAYLRSFHPDAPRPEGALGSFRLAFAAIAASGGSHLIAGEGEGLLAEAYYPRHGRLSERELATVRRYFDFAVRNVDLLLGGGSVDHAWTDVGPTNGVIVLEHPRLGFYGAGARPRSLWTVVRRQGSRTVLHLVNLPADDRWNAPHAAAEPLADLVVRARVTEPPSAAWWDTPDDEVGAARPLAVELTAAPDGPQLVLRVPHVGTWTTVWWDAPEPSRP